MEHFLEESGFGVQQTIVDFDFRSKLTKVSTIWYLAYCKYGISTIRSVSLSRGDISNHSLGDK